VGAINAGLYEIPASEGPIVGAQRIEIRSEQELGFALDDPEQFRKQRTPKLPKDPIPKEYNEDSTLVRQISADGENTLDFELVTK
jgi:hypothetical protein